MESLLTMRIRMFIFFLAEFVTAARSPTTLVTDMRSFSNQIQGPPRFKRGPKRNTRRHATIRLALQGKSWSSLHYLYHIGFFPFGSFVHSGSSPDRRHKASRWTGNGNSHMESHKSPTSMHGLCHRSASDCFSSASTQASVELYPYTSALRWHLRLKGWASMKRLWPKDKGKQSRNICWSSFWDVNWKAWKYSTKTPQKVVGGVSAVFTSLCQKKRGYLLLVLLIFLLLFFYTPPQNERQMCIEAAHLKMRSYQALIPKTTGRGTMAGLCSAVGWVVKEVWSDKNSNMLDATSHEDTSHAELLDWECRCGASWLKINYVTK